MVVDLLSVIPFESFYLVLNAAFRVESTILGFLIDFATVVSSEQLLSSSGLPAVLW
jgi:hypothetical protein